MNRPSYRRHGAIVLAVGFFAVACSAGTDRTNDAAVGEVSSATQSAASTSAGPATDDGATETDAAPTGSTLADTQSATRADATEQDATGDDATGADTRYLTGSSDKLFDPTKLHTFEIDVPEASLAEIDADPTAEEYVEGSLTFDGETVAPIGVRYKGSVGAFVFCTDGPNPLQPSGAKTCRKLSMKLKMNWVDSNDEFYGVRRVQLHAQNLDATKMHERLGYWLFREMGVPAPRSTHARVVLNGEYLGLFALTEQIDGRFTRENFDDGTGNLYKEVWPFDASGEPTAADDLIDALRTNEDENPTTDIVSSFASEFVDAADDERLEVIDRWTDRDTLLTTMVVDRAIKNDDGPLHWYCFDGCGPHNFYWYEDPTAERLTLIPWDLDNAFDNLGAGGGTTGAVTRIADEWGETSFDCEPFPFGPLGLPQRSAACDPLIGTLAELSDDYDRIRTELVSGPFSADRIDEQLATWSAQIEPAVAESAALFDDATSVADWRESIDALRDDIAAGRATSGR